MVKDIGKLLYSRSTEEIIIIETDQKRIDDNFLSSFIFLQYDGSINYSQLIMLKQMIKSINGEESS